MFTTQESLVAYLGSFKANKLNMLEMELSPSYNT